MIFSRTFVALAIFFASSALYAGEAPGPAMRCAMDLNELATEALGRTVTLRWLGANPHAETPYGWMRFAFPVFDRMLLRANVSQDRIDKMKAWLTSLRLSESEARELEPDSPALAASFAAATFFRLNQQGRDLHATIVPYELSDLFPLGGNAFFLYGRENFYFLPEGEMDGMALVGRRNLRLVRPLEALLFRRPSRNASDDELMEWIADLLAGITRWQDLDFVSRYLRDARPDRKEIFRGVVGSDADGNVVLATPYWPVFFESRAEAVRAWVLHRLCGDDWETAWHDGQQRALESVAAYTSPEEIAPYTALPNGIFWDHVQPIDRELRQF